MTSQATATEPILGLGVPIGVNDCKGRPIRIGDVLRFDEREWGSPMEFTVVLKDGLIQHPGATSDLSEWCEIVRPYDGDTLALTLSPEARNTVDSIRRSFEGDAETINRILEVVGGCADDFDHFYGEPRDGRGPSGT